MVLVWQCPRIWQGGEREISVIWSAVATLVHTSSIPPSCRVYLKFTPTSLLKASFFWTLMHRRRRYHSKNTLGGFHKSGVTSAKKITREQISNVYTCMRLDSLICASRYAYSWQVEGNYNWKTLMDGYQECYHCTFVTFTIFKRQMRL